jgi:hypothetical protein
VTDCVEVECPECDEQAIELGSGTVVTCLCTCGAMLLICRDRDGRLARREVIDQKEVASVADSSTQSAKNSEQESR